MQKDGAFGSSPLALQPPPHLLSLPPARRDPGCLTRTLLLSWLLFRRAELVLEVMWLNCFPAAHPQSTLLHQEL